MFSKTNFKNKKVLVRVDFNVPLNDDFSIADDTRIQAALPTIKKIVADGGSPILMSHLGRPKKGPEEKFSLKHLLKYLKKQLPFEVLFAEDCIGLEAVKASKDLQATQVLLLENLRFHKQEKAGDESFAKQLAHLADVYVNDAFGTAHRAHASTAIIAKFFKPENKMFGLLMEKEVNNLKQVMASKAKPVTAIIGGAKISGKINVVENLLDVVDHLIIGGGMAYTFYKAQGYNIGNSLFEAERVEVAQRALVKASANQVQIHLPVDSLVADNFSENARTQTTVDQNIPMDWMGLDIGPKTIANYKTIILNSKTILWNGPMGVFEIEKFKSGTLEIAKAIAEATSNNSYSLVGGGDSVAALKQFELQNKVSYVSTGGGAMLAMLEGKELPGVKAMS